MISSITFIGISSSAGQNRHTYVAINNSCEVISMGNVSRADLLSRLEEFEVILAAINLPSQLNLYLKSYANSQENFLPIDFNQCFPKERSRVNMAPQTHDKSHIPVWFQRNRKFIDKLVEIGYKPYQQTTYADSWFSSSAELTYRRLLTVSPYASRTIEGRIQRQLFLYNLGIQIPDPMDFFEEITRHRILQSTLSYDKIISYPELDSFILAYLAWLSHSHPDKVNIINTQSEEKVIFPISGMPLTLRPIK